jgi:hypothetical protein
LFFWGLGMMESWNHGILGFNKNENSEARAIYNDLMEN